MASLVEGLGTKNIVAQKWYELTGDVSGFASVSKDTIAMIVNDLITVGALPEVIGMYFGVGASEWMNDEKRAEAIINGWLEGCNLSGAIWGPGETPSLKNIIAPEYPDMAGYSYGEIQRANYLHGGKIKDGDQIIIVRSSGIHANGLTAARKVADMLPHGYKTELSNGMYYGEALLRPTHNYVEVMRKIQDRGIPIHYAVNVTGHGWRKAMRANGDFRYTFNSVPEIDPVFDIIQKTLGLSIQEMYADFNMGAGFLIYTPENSACLVLNACLSSHIFAFIAGEISADEKKNVVIKPLGITFSAEELDIR